jgi:putative tricarboxylic transport membrane protein
MARVRTPWEFIDRPIAFILFAMIVLAIGLHIRSIAKARKSRQGKAADA